MNRAAGVTAAIVLLASSMYSTTAHAQPTCLAPNHFVCINVGQPHCLRGLQRDGVVVRDVLKLDDFNIGKEPGTSGQQHHVILESPNHSAACQLSKAPPPNYLPNGNEEIKLTNLQFNIYAKTPTGSQHPFFTKDLTLTPSVLVGAGTYLLGSTRELDRQNALPETHFDYFIMLVDANRGHPVTPGQGSIEKYYRIEIFPSDDNPNRPSDELGCQAERPDALYPTVLPGGAIVNLTNWSTSTAVGQCFADCRGKKKDSPWCQRETTSSGGGEH